MRPSVDGGVLGRGAMKAVLAIAAMKAVLALATVCLLIGGAAAQSFQTALPLSPQERRALEARLATILDRATANDLSRFALPSGRTVTVRPYRVVRRPGAQPCRGYRIDLRGRTTRVAVDGFRCRRRDGRSWTIVEPELVLVDERRRADARGGEALEPGRFDNEPLYPADDPGAAPAPPPVPRPAPRDELRADEALPAEGNEAVADAPASGAPDDDEAPPLAERVAAALAEPADAQAAEAEPAADAPGAVRENEAESPAEADPGTRTRVAAEPQPEDTGRAPAAEDERAEEGARVVGAADTGREADWSSDPALIAALQDLSYLPEDTEPSAQAIGDAIDAFALDERFALPVPGEVLMERLEAAIERSETMPECGAPGAGAPCLTAAGR